MTHMLGLYFNHCCWSIACVNRFLDLTSKFFSFFFSPLTFYCNSSAGLWALCSTAACETALKVCEFLLSWLGRPHMQSSPRGTPPVYFNTFTPRHLRRSCRDDARTTILSPPLDERRTDVSERGGVQSAVFWRIKDPHASRPRPAHRASMTIQTSKPYETLFKSQLLIISNSYQ